MAVVGAQCPSPVVKVILNPDMDVDAAYADLLNELEQLSLGEVTAKINELNDVDAINATAKAMANTFISAMDAE